MKQCQKTIATVLTAIYALALCIPVFAAGREDTQALLDRVNPEYMELLESATLRLAKETGEMFAEYRDDFMLSDFSEEALLNLTLSEPIHMFMIPRDYRHTEDLLPQLEQNRGSVLMFCYADGQTVGYILAERAFIVEERAVSYAGTQWAGKPNAERYERMIHQLGGDAAAMLSIHGRFYFINEDGEITGTDDARYSLISFADIEAATQKSYSRIPDPENATLGGGSFIFDQLYPEIPEPGGTDKTILYIILPVIALLFAVMIVLYIRSSKKPRKA